MKKLILLALCCCASLLRAESNGAVCRPEGVCLPGDAVFFTATDAAAKGYLATLASTRGSLSPITLIPLAEAPAVNAAASACVQPALPPAGNAPPAEAKPAPPPKGFCLLIPRDVSDGTYSVKITERENAAAALSAVSPAQIVVQRPAITAVWPEGSFLEAASGSIVANKIVVLGKGFRRGETTAATPAAAPANTASVANLQLRFPYAATPDKCPPASANRKKTNCYEINADTDQQVTVTFYGVSSGTKAFTLVLDGVETNESTLTLINAGAGYPLIAAIVGVLMIALLMYLVLHAGKHATKQKLNGKEYWLSTLFLDVPTNSYSLSKCQFYAWTAAAVFGYIFLAVSKSVVQGSGVFPDIPPGLPGILLASVGTVVVSQGIASAKGDKGAGNPGPNLSDFISSGGVIAADRLQFAVWTLIGIGTFLSIVIQTDPRKINDLPAIPSGFLQLMGISSAGYLAGKLVRKPGPTITNLTVKYTKPPNPPVQPANPQQAAPKSTLRFEITGAGLSRSALFSIGDQQIFPDVLVGDNGQKGAQILKADPSNNDPDLASVLTFTVPDPPDTYLGQHPFTITNPDAQKAVKDFQVFNIKDVAISNAAKTITVTGECLGANLKPTCPGCGDATPADGSTDKSFVWKVDPVPAVGTQVTVTFADGSAGGKLDWQTTVQA